MLNPITVPGNDSLYMETEFRVCRTKQARVWDSMEFE